MCSGSIRIRAAGSNEGDICASPGSSDCLVCAFAPAEHLEIAPEDSFAWPRQVITNDNKIGI
jgi:hypothetical protein